MDIGVVGLGYWGSKVFEEYCDLRDDGAIDSVVAIDADPDVIDDIQGANHSFESVSRAVSAVDAFHVATSNASHYPIAEIALKNEKDVLLEKPLTTDREDAFDLVELASEKGCILQTGHIFRFANVIREVKERYENGYFGEIEHITLRWTHDFQPTGGEEVTWDLLPHPIDILNFVTSEWPVNVTGFANVSDESGVPTAAHVAFSLGQAKGLIQVSWLDKQRRRSLEIAGSRRSATVECVEQEITVYDGDSTETIDVTANNTIRAEAENFITASETGKNTFNSAIVGARTVAAIERINGALSND